MEFLAAFIIGFAVFLLVKKKRKIAPHGHKKYKASSTAHTPNFINEKQVQYDEHRKKEFLTTKNERKLFFALQKVLNSKKCMVHCQTSLIALVEPLEDKGRAWSKRMDFVITDTASKILAVIELDDSSHLRSDRQARDKYVNLGLVK